MSPVLIVLLVIVGLVVAVYLFGLSSEPARRRDPGILRRRSKWRRWVPVLPLLAAIGCLALAFSGFSLSLQQTTPITMLAMDTSDSMNATDVAPTRLSAAQSAAVAFLDEVPTDFLVGLATFAGAPPQVVVPPTEDRHAVERALGGLTTSNGTRIGDGLTKALDAIEAERSDTDVPAAVVLLSDGRDTGSEVAPLDAAERARTMAVPVYTVVFGAVTGEEGADVVTLQTIARTSDGETFTAETADQLTRRFTTIGSQLSVELAVQPSATPLVIAALVLVVVAGFLLVATPR